MTKALPLSLLLCGLATVAGCGADAPQGSLPGGSGSGSVGGSSAGAPAAGSTSSSAGSGGSAPVNTTGGAGSGNQPTAGTNAGGTSAGSSQGGQAGSSTAAGAGGGGGAAAGSGGSGGLPPLVECMNKPSVDHLTDWEASGEGLTTPKTGSILVKDGASYVGKVTFIGADYHVIPVYVANAYGKTADFTNSKSFTLTYSATTALHVQLRTLSHWNGGDQYATDIPSTGGQKQTKTFPFAEANWASLFNKPALSFADTLKEAMGMVFVGQGDNTVAFYGLRFDGYTPACQ